jgi:hypothetical protein
VYGFYRSHPVAPPECTSPVGFCTAGELIGGIQGTYAFTMTSVAPSQEPTTPGVIFYSGHSVVSPKGGAGDAVLATDNGAIDLGATGRQAALLTITGGTGAYGGATGYLLLRGTLDPLTSEVSGDYVGEICSP